MRRLFIAVLALALAYGPSAAPATPDEMAERAFEGAQWVMATAAARAIARVGARAAAGEGPLGDRIRARQALEDALDRDRAALAEAVAAGLPADSLRRQIETLRADIALAAAEIGRDFPRYAELADPRPLDYAALRAQLGPDEALVLFLSDRAATYVWAISDEAAHWHRAGLGLADLTEAIRRLRRDLDPTAPARGAVKLSPGPAASPAAAPFDAETAYALYKALLAPAEPVLRGKSHLYLVKDGPLGSLPLAVLLTEPAATGTPEALRAAPWLVRRHALTTLPAVSSLASLRAAVNAVPPEPMFVGFGDPDFSGKGFAAPLVLASRSVDGFFDTRGTRTDAVRALPHLPGTTRELQQIADLFPPNRARLILGAEATEAAVRGADLSSATILSFATHGLVSGDLSGLAEPALAFSPPQIASAGDDGLLTASEASTLRLSADWVILSACNTAAGDGAPGSEGLSGLARAFLFAGARSVLASHWPVRDDVAATLTSDMLRRLRDDPALPRSQALRLAMLGLLAESQDAKLAHPSAWAPFVVVGEGGALGR